MVVSDSGDDDIFRLRNLIFCRTLILSVDQAQSFL